MTFSKNNFRMLAVACLGALFGFALAQSMPTVAAPEPTISNNALQKKNVEIVQDALTKARGGQLDVIEPLFAKDFVLYESPGLPFGGTYHGWQGYKDVLGKIKLTLKDSKHIDREFVAIDDSRVLVHFGLDAKIVKNDQHVEMPIAAIWTVKNGQIVEIRPFFFDTKKIADLAAM
jgi:ketosteroid isomerase-like protein